jgi:hypothetical protein
VNGAVRHCERMHAAACLRSLLMLMVATRRDLVNVPTCLRAIDAKIDALAFRVAFVEREIVS